MEYLLETVLVNDVRKYMEKRYSKEEIEKRGLVEDEDIMRLLKDNRHLTNFKETQIIDFYMEHQRIAEVFDFDEDGNAIPNRW